MLWVDLGISHAGFHSDFGRTWIVGREPTARQRAQYDQWQSIMGAVLEVTRAGATAGDYVVTVNWGDGSAPQQALLVPDLLHSGQFDLIADTRVYLELFTSLKVTVTFSTIGKFGAAGATTTITSTIEA